MLHLGDDEAVRTVAARLGVDPVAPANPYRSEHGLTFEDPDGSRANSVASPRFRQRIVTRCRPTVRREAAEDEVLGP